MFSRNMDAYKTAVWLPRGGHPTLFWYLHVLLHVVPAQLLELFRLSLGRTLSTQRSSALRLLVACASLPMPLEMKLDSMLESFKSSIYEHIYMAYIRPEACPEAILSLLEPFDTLALQLMPSLARALGLLRATQQGLASSAGFLAYLEAFLTHE